MIEVKNLCFSYRKEPILEDISFNISKGEVVTLLGPNGSGKSTLIKLLLKLLSPDQGGVFFNGKNINKIKHKDLAKQMAYVPQSSYIPFSYTVLDVVIMARVMYKGIFSRYSKKDEILSKEAIKKVGICHLIDSNYNELSGGQQQLVLIARALAQGATVLIMDEPVSGLDFGNQMKLLKTIKELATLGYTFLQSTHYPDHAFMVSDTSIVLNESKILEQGKTSEIITENILEQIYGIDIKIESLQNGNRVCTVNI